MLIHASWSSVCLLLEWVWWSLMNYLDPRIRLKCKVYTVILRRAWWRERRWQSGRFPVSVGVWISYLCSGWRHLCKAYWGRGLLSSGNWPVEVESRRLVRMKVSSIRNDEQWSDSDEQMEEQLHPGAQSRMMAAHQSTWSRGPEKKSPATSRSKQTNGRLKLAC